MLGFVFFFTHPVDWDKNMDALEEKDGLEEEIKKGLFDEYDTFLDIWNFCDNILKETEDQTRKKKLEFESCKEDK